MLATSESFNGFAFMLFTLQLGYARITLKSSAHHAAIQL
jgi:hypothetical protein